MAAGAAQSGLSRVDQRWREYLERIRGRDSSALHALYDETSRVLYSLAYRVLNDPEDAEEVFLDVYQQAWNSADRFDPARCTVLSWLAVVTRNRATEDPVETTDESPAPEILSILEQQRRLVRQAMATLAKDQREAIELAFYSGMSHGEVAEALGEPLETVKTRIRVGMQKLRKALPADLWAGRS